MSKVIDTARENLPPSPSLGMTPISSVAKSHTFAVITPFSGLQSSALVLDFFAGLPPPVFQISEAENG
jgi:hypothetical protein